MKIKKDDTVRVITGKDKGREGKVVRVYQKSNKVLVENINMFKKHIKKSEQAPDGGVVEVSRPLDVSNVMVIDSKSKKTTRIGYVIEEDKKKRIFKKSKQVIS